MKIITLSKGYETIVDDELYEALNIHKWYYQRYARRHSPTKEGKRTTITMHREVIKLSGVVLLDTQQVDHKNCNRLDNRLENLRVCNIQANTFNRRVHSKSGYKGVRKTYHKWTAAIYKDGKRYHLGNYDSPEGAAQAYNDKAIELFGEYAWLNPL